MGFYRQEYWSGLPCHPPGNLPKPGIDLESLRSPALAGRFFVLFCFTTSATWEPLIYVIYVYMWGSPCGSVLKNLPAMYEPQDTWVVSWVGNFPWRWHGCPYQHSCLENPMDREAWWAIVHEVTKSQTQLKQLRTHSCMYVCVCMHIHTHTCT